jgi:Lrp/AsnC family leucine-responsive transcriptional regulator
MKIDETDLALISALLDEGSLSYAQLGRVAGLSPAAAHERVRKLRAGGVIRRNTIEVDAHAVGRGVLAFVTLSANAWIGGGTTREQLIAIPEIQEAHIIAGSASLLLKVRSSSTAAIQDVLSRLFQIPGVAATDTTIVLETVFERPLDVGLRRSDQD